MVSELLVKRLKGSIGLEFILFLSNGFRFEGKIISCDDEFLEFYDIKKFRNKLVKLSEILECELKNDKKQ